MIFKCRCWDKNINQMFVPTMINKDGDCRHNGIATSKESENYYSKGEKFESWIPNSNLDVMLYTNRNDVNKKEIYLLDIVKLFIDNKVENFIVKYDNDKCEFYFCGIKTGVRYKFNSSIYIVLLGNYYENPELYKDDNLIL